VRADKDEAADAAGDNQKTSERERGGGSVTILGNPMAQPEGTCIVAGVRPGIDGAYKIEGVDHTLSRGGGFETKLDLKHPDGEAGSDSR
jgi:phage protein D